MGLERVTEVSVEHKKARGQPGVFCVNMSTMKTMSGRKRVMKGVIA